MLAFIEYVELFQAGATATVAAVLLAVFVRERGEFIKSLKAVSVTIVTFQQMVLALGITKPDRKPETPHECDECCKRIEAIETIIERQRATLERELSK